MFPETEIDRHLAGCQECLVSRKRGGAKYWRMWIKLKRLERSKAIELFMAGEISGFILQEAFIELPF